MPSAKGLVAEHHPQYIETYWGVVNTTFCAEIVKSADAYLFAGPIFNDCSSVGYSLLLKKAKSIIVQPDRVVIGNGPAFGCVLMKDFLSALAKRLKHNNTALYIRYEFQMQYGSIGWSVGATLGYAQAAQNKRLISCISDGSFRINGLNYCNDHRVTAQDMSTMLRCGQNTIIFLINNGGYSAEIQIHDGSYNVRCEEELIEAIGTATSEKKDCLCFVEVILHKHNTSKELLEFGRRIAAANSQPPNPH
ncbi:hypothetical protein Vadar_009173 [Vaccinium darrowii]|uniref:Uncharacterized protein n=1 Tax=Vaccinium darrowii TaxID=229202 RepID=A0ACB7ZI34_9ERIC|nr:hypothetical protein Vadar_009173 [Vaccinium darrowii]